MKNRTMKGAAVASAAALVLTSCGGGGEGGDDEAVFVQAVGSLPHLNPKFFVSLAVRVVGGSILEPLVKIDDQYEIAPWLAHD